MADLLVQLGRCLPPRWRQRLRREILLYRPSRYAMDSIRYEQSLAPEELEALIAKLDGVLDIPGDVIECGCFLCGTTVHLARHLQARQPGKDLPAPRVAAGSPKRIYACDTFEGFDPVELSCQRGKGDAANRRDYAENDLRYIRRKLRRLGVADRVTLVQGLFQKTLESLSGPFCFAFIDCDLHDSMLYAARTVWPRLSAGGGCVFDDYTNDEYRGVTRAVDTFLTEQASSISEHGRLCRKMYFAVKAG